MGLKLLQREKLRRWRIRRWLKKHPGPGISSKEMDAVLKDVYSNAVDLSKEPFPGMTFLGFAVEDQGNGFAKLTPQFKKDEE